MTGHENLKSARKVSRPSNRKFGLVFAGLFLLIGLWPALRHGEGIRWWGLAAGAAFGGLAFLKDSALAPLNELWFKLGLALHAVMGPLIMGLMYFCVVSPIGIALRMLGKDPLRLRASPGSTYWISREPPGPAANSMKQQF
jgi:Saxitoxin biosynthesis operon protein SxtJ